MKRYVKFVERKYGCMNVHTKTSKIVRYLFRKSCFYFPFHEDDDGGNEAEKKRAIYQALGYLKEENGRGTRLAGTTVIESHTKRFQD